MSSLAHAAGGAAFDAPAHAAQCMPAMRKAVSIEEMNAVIARRGASAK